MCGLGHGVEPIEGVECQDAKVFLILNLWSVAKWPTHSRGVSSIKEQTNQDSTQKVGCTSHQSDEMIHFLGDRCFPTCDTSLHLAKSDIEGAPDTNGDKQPMHAEFPLQTCMHWLDFNGNADTDHKDAEEDACKHAWK